MHDKKSADRCEDRIAPRAGAGQLIAHALWRVRRMLADEGPRADLDSVAGDLEAALRILHYEIRDIQAAYGYTDVGPQAWGDGGPVKGRKGRR